MENKTCLTCGTIMEFHAAGTRKDGTSYKAFYGCPLWKDDEHKRAKEEWKKAVESDSNDSENYSSSRFAPKIVDLNGLIMDELKAIGKEINEKLDKILEK